MKLIIGVILLAFVLIILPLDVKAQEIQLPQDVVWGLSWSPDGTKIATGRYNGAVEIRNASSGQIVLTLQTGNALPIATVAWSPDGLRIAASDGGTGVFIWDATTGSLQRTLLGQHTTYVANLSWSPDNTKIAGTAPFEYLLQVWNTNTGSIIYHLAGAQKNLEWFQNQLAVTAGNGIQVIDGNTGNYLRGIGLHPRDVLAVSWNSDGSRIASAGMDNTVRIWNANTTQPIDQNQPLHILTGHTLPINEVDWQPNGTMLASASYDGSIKIWDTTTGQLLQTIQAGGTVLRVQWNSSGTILAYAGDVAALGGVVRIALPPSAITCNFSPADFAALRTAIDSANSTPSTPDTICLSLTGNYSMSEAPSGYNADGSNGLPSITSPITLIGNGGTATLARTTGSPNFRILRVASGGTLTLNNVIVQGGNAGSSGGGGIRNLGTLTLLNGSTVQNNTAAGGGGIYNLNGTVNLSGGSQVLGNTSTSSGGGLYNNGGTVTLDGVTLSNNSANTSSGSGGGIYNSNGNLTIQGSSTLSTNTARLGGGIYLTDTGSHSASVDMSVSISSNTATNNGGGVYINNGTVTIGNASGGLVTVSSNLATNSGSGLYQAGGNLTLRYCTVSSNGSSTAGSGGGIRSASTLTISHCTFANNRVNTASGLGAGIYLNSSAAVSISNSTISNDPATAAARNGAGLFVSTAATVNISASTFTGNRAQHIGGGLFVDLGNTANISTTTFNNNSAVDQGGAIANYGTLTLTTSNLTNNNGGSYGGALVNDNSTTGDAISQTCVTGNTATSGSALYSFTATLNAENNWWGSTSGAGSSVNANVDANPYLSSCPNG